MNRTRTLLALAGTAHLALFLACSGGGGGGGTTTPTATTLSYTDPTSGSWQLKKDASSTNTHLVLNLVANAAGTGAGVAVILNVDTTKVTWAHVSGSNYVQPGAVFTLGAAPQALKEKASGSTLQIGISQKGLASVSASNPAPVTLNGTVATIALDLKSGATTGAVSLAQVANKATVLDGTGTIAPITVTAGTLTAN